MAPGAPAAIAGRGADPAIQIPAAHFFRRVQRLTLAPIPGALAPVPTTLPQSLVEFVLGPAVTTEGVAAVSGVAFLENKVLPTKLDAALTQLEAEPAGVGLSPLAVYDGLEDAAAAVRGAIARVAALPGARHPAYVLNAGDMYAVEPMPVGALAAMRELVTIPTALTLGHLEGPGFFLVHYGVVAFQFFGSSQSATRDAPGQPTRRGLTQLAQMAAAAGFAPAPLAGALVGATAFHDWLGATDLPGYACFAAFSAHPESREQNFRSRHNLRFGTDDQKELALAHLLSVEPLRSRFGNLARVLGAGATLAEVTQAGQRLAQLFGSATSRMTSPAVAESVDAALKEPVRSLSTPGALVATVGDRVSRVEETVRAAAGSSTSGDRRAPTSIYSDDLSSALDDPVKWRATETALIAEMAQPVPNLVIIMETLTNSAVVGARKLALGQFPRTEEDRRLISLSRPLSRALDLLASASASAADGHKEDPRVRVVADALVADPTTRLPTTASQVSFHLVFPKEVARQILRGAFDEISYVELLQLVQSANTPGQPPGQYPQGLYDPLLPPLLSPLLDRVSRLVGIPLAAPLPPAPPMPHFASLSTILTSIAAEYSRLHGHPNGYLTSNMQKLHEFANAAWREAASTFHNVLGGANPAGPVVVSLFGPRSGALAKLAELSRSIVTQNTTAQTQPEMHQILSQVAEHGGLENYVRSLGMSRSSRGASPGYSKQSNKKTITEPSSTPGIYVLIHNEHT